MCENTPPSTIVFDLDSTLADTRPRRHLCPTVDATKTWTDYALGCANDTLMPGAAELLRLCWDAGHTIHILSWRDQAAHALTLTWLARHNLPYDVLRLRKPTDPEDSTAFKLDYIKHLRDVRLVVEDWPDAAAAIEALGIPVLCVNPRYNTIPAATP